MRGAELLTAMTARDAARFWEKVQRAGPDECWMWKAAKNPTGYGMFGLGGRAGRPLLAHRVAFVLGGGGVPASSVYICHRCDAPGCCNPAHLFAGSAKDNFQDMRSKGRFRPGKISGERHWLSTLTDEHVRAVRALGAAGFSDCAVARVTGIRRDVVWGIRHRRRWSHVQ